MVRYFVEPQLYEVLGKGEREEGDTEQDFRSKRAKCRNETRR